MNLLDAVIIILASDAIISAWRTGSLFSRERAILEAKTGFFPELLSCAFCLSYHVPAWVAIFISGSHLLDEPWKSIIQWPFCSLALTSVLNIKRRLLKEEPYSQD